MKAVSFRTSMTEGESFKVQVDQLPYFYDRLHYHPEIQLTLIVKGYGSFFIGNRIIPFQVGDVLLIGSNVPHMWKNDPVFYEDQTLGVHAISVHFNQEALGERFLGLPELSHIRRLFARSSRGLSLSGQLQTQARQMLEKMESLQGFERLLLLFELLHEISQREAEQIALANISFEVMEGTGDQKLNQVFQYVMDHFHQPLSLPQVAGIANLSVSAFCRYFKLRTRKTFVRFLNEIRIDAACKQLLEGNHNVTEICYQVGFNNLSNFNRQFKHIMKCTPSEYIKNSTLN